MTPLLAKYYDYGEPHEGESLPPLALLIGIVALWFFFSYVPWLIYRLRKWRKGEEAFGYFEGWRERWQEWKKGDFSSSGSGRGYGGDFGGDC